MRENKLKAIWQSGGHAVFGQCAIGSPVVAEVMANQGYDAILVDMQHGAISYDTMSATLQAISTTSAVPVVRVPWNQPAYMMQALDAGAYAVIAPMINSQAECRAFVEACRYAPQGYRSWGPVRAELYGGPDYFARANDTVLPIAMIETEAAAERVEEIVSVPGLAGVYIGPADLSITLGLSPPGDEPEPHVVRLIESVIQAAARRGIAAGTHANTPAFARKMIKAGCKFVVLGVDMGFIAPGARALLDELNGNRVHSGAGK
jgi:4-hydroxy-2-oxoheptanedioate aldolase